MRRRDCWRISPDILVQNVVARLQQLGGGEAIPLEGREENIVFEAERAASRYS